MASSDAMTAVKNGYSDADSRLTCIIEVQFKTLTRAAPSIGLHNHSVTTGGLRNITQMQKHRYQNSENTRVILRTNIHNEYRDKLLHIYV